MTARYTGVRGQREALRENGGNLQDTWTGVNNVSQVVTPEPHGREMLTSGEMGWGVGGAPEKSLYRLCNCSLRLTLLENKRGVLNKNM